jgi:hypothetical protein
MGTNISKQNTESMTESIQNSLTSVSNTFENTMSATTKAHTEISIIIRNSTVRDVTSTAKTGVGVTAILTSDANITANLTDSLTATINKTLTSTLEQANEDLNFGQTNIGVTDVKSKTINRSDVEKIIKTGIKNSTSTNTDGTVIISVILDNIKGRDVTASSETVITALASNMTKAVADTVASTTLTFDEKATLTSAVTQTNKGLDVMAFATLIGLAIAAVIGLLGVRSLKSADHAIDACVSSPQLCQNLVDTGVSAAKGPGWRPPDRGTLTQLPSQQPMQQPMGQPMQLQQPMGQPMQLQQPMGQPMQLQQPMGQPMQQPIPMDIPVQQSSQQQTNISTSQPTSMRQSTNLPPAPPRGYSGVYQSQPQVSSTNSAGTKPLPGPPPRRENNTNNILPINNKQNVTYTQNPNFANEWDIRNEAAIANRDANYSNLLGGGRPAGKPDMRKLLQDKEKQKKIITAVIVLFVVIMLIQYQIHVKWAKIHMNPIIAKVSEYKDKPPNTIFKFVPAEYLPLYEIPGFSVFTSYKST